MKLFGVFHDDFNFSYGNGSFRVLPVIVLKSLHRLQNADDNKWK